VLTLTAGFVIRLLFATFLSSLCSTDFASPLPVIADVIDSLMADASLSSAFASFSPDETTSFGYYTWQIVVVLVQFF